MALGRSYAISLVGMAGKVITVEAHLADGVPGLSITGLPDASLQEARDRVRAALVNSGEAWPSNRKVTVGLSPAAHPKKGSGFDLAIVAALLAANGVVPMDALEGQVLLGELGLDGTVRSVPGVLPALSAAQAAGFERAVVPLSNLAEAQLLPGLGAQGVSCLRSLVDLLRGHAWDESAPHAPSRPDDDTAPPDYLDVAGQPMGRLACLVAAAGGHNLLMTGPPGCGKTLLAERLPGILPPLSVQERLDVTMIHSVAGLLPTDVPLISAPPFQAPHHGSSAMAIIGGGPGIARPGAASLAHRGVLFLDEAPEFKRDVLDSLRQCLESGSITIRRVGGTATYPARFSLVMAANPCPCAKTASQCTCTPDRRRGYLGKLSGPVMDRMDISIELPPILRADIVAERGHGESTASMAARVLEARARAERRFAGTPWRTNADVPGTVGAEHWPIPRADLVVAGHFLDRGVLTARGYHRVQRLAWTLADLGGRPVPSKDDVASALSLRLGKAMNGGQVA